jgi:hypothetical protein
MVIPVEEIEVDLPVDLQTEDDSGLPWGLIDEAREPGLIEEGRWIVVGNPELRAVAHGAVVRVRILPGPLSRHIDLLGHLA